MAEKKVKTRIQNKHDFEVNWIQASNFVPMKGELIIYDPEVDSSGTILTTLPEGRTTPYTYPRFKIGDGVKYVSDLDFQADLDKVNKTNIAYGLCSTAAATAAKVITISGNTKWELLPGSRITINFANTNTATNPTFNVDNTGARPVWYNTALITVSNLSYAGYKNRPMDFIFDGTQYVFIGWSYDADTTYTNASLGQGYGPCRQSASVSAKTAAVPNYILSVGGVVSVKFTNDVESGATLNVTNQGAKPIYHKGAAITDGIINGGDTATFIYDGTNYHLIGLDRAFDHDHASISGTASYANTASNADQALNAYAAQRATGDEDGNDIKETYETKANAITGLSVDGKTITYTKGNGTTGTITTQDTVTTVDTALSATSTNPVQNKVVHDAIAAAKDPWFGICSSPFDANKEVNVGEGFVLKEGVLITVKFTYFNYVASAKLNVNGTGDFYIKRLDGNYTLDQGNDWPNGAIIEFMFDGTCWQIINSSFRASTNGYGYTKLSDSVAGGSSADDGVGIAATPQAVRAAKDIAKRGWYGTCQTSYSNAAKVVTTGDSGFILTTGTKISVKFTYYNTAASPTLNVDNSGAIAIKKYGTTAVDTYSWNSGAVIDFEYDGTNWIMIDGGTATTTYYGKTKLSSSTSSTSTTLAATASAVKAAYDAAVDAKRGWTATCDSSCTSTAKIALLNSSSIPFTLEGGTRVSVRFEEANEIYPITLNVAGTGDHEVRTGTSSVVEYIWQAGEYVDFIFDGTYWQILDGGRATTYSWGKTCLSTSTNSTSTTFAATSSAVKSAYDKATQAYDNTKWYCVCSTATSASAKTATLSGFQLVDGVRVVVKFSYNNTASAPTLNINSTGAKQIYSGGSRLTTDLFEGFYELMYNSTNSRYEVISGPGYKVGTITYTGYAGSTSTTTTATLNWVQCGRMVTLSGTLPYSSNPKITAFRPASSTAFPKPARAVSFISSQCFLTLATTGYITCSAYFDKTGDDGTCQWLVEGSFNRNNEITVTYYTDQ